jgi:hypothetical protein
LQFASWFAKKLLRHRCKTDHRCTNLKEIKPALQKYLFASENKRLPGFSEVFLTGLGSQFISMNINVDDLNITNAKPIDINTKSRLSLWKMTRLLHKKFNGSQQILQCLHHFQILRFPDL